MEEKCLIMSTFSSGGAAVFRFDSSVKLLLNTKCSSRYYILTDKLTKCNAYKDLDFITHCVHDFLQDQCILPEIRERFVTENRTVHHALSLQPTVLRR